MPCHQVPHRERRPGLVQVPHRVGARHRILHPPDHHHRHRAPGLLERVRAQPRGDRDDAVHVQVEQALQLAFEMVAVAPAMGDHHPEPEGLRLRLDPGDDIGVVRIAEVRGDHPDQSRAAPSSAVSQPPRREQHPLPGAPSHPGTIVQRHRRRRRGDPRLPGDVCERDARTAEGPGAPLPLQRPQPCGPRSARGSCWSVSPAALRPAVVLMPPVYPRKSVLTGGSEDFRSRDRSVPRFTPSSRERARSPSVAGARREPGLARPAS